MNTETPPPSPLSNTECLSILTDSHLVGVLTPLQSRALLRAVHALARRTMQKERNARARESRKGAFFTPPAILANPPFALAAAEPEPEQKETENANR